MGDARKDALPFEWHFVDLRSRSRRGQRRNDWCQPCASPTND